MWEWDDLKRAYNEKRPLLDRASQDLSGSIAALIQDFERQGLFRATRLHRRVKSLESVFLKCMRHGIELEKALDVMNDLVGVRIVCHTVSDVEKVVSAIKALLKRKKVKLSLDDRITSPANSGYRAVHVTFHWPTQYQDAEKPIPCEIQVRTVFQDAWAELSHFDLYKQPYDTPSIIHKLAKRMADHIEVLDATAEDLRTALASPGDVSKEPSGNNENAVTRFNLGKTFLERYDKVPSEYEVHQWFTALKDLRFDTLDEVREYIADEGLMEHVGEMISDVTSWSFPEVEWLIYAAYMKRLGTHAAGQVFRENYIRARNRWWPEYLPDTLEELVDMLTPRTKDDQDFGARLLADLGLMRSCHRCGNECVAPDEAAHELLDWYGADEDTVDLQSKIAESGADICDGGLCSWCSHMVDRYKND